MSTKRNKKKTPIPAVIVLLLIIIPSVISAVNNQNHSDKPVNQIQNNGKNIVVHYLDVGQGDSAFIELPNGECMLIDAGTAEYSQTIIDDIEAYGYSELDYVVATHPHADHIGGMRDVINSFDIGEIYMPKASTDTRTFENLLNTISQKGFSINTAKAGTEVYSDSELKIEFLAPVNSYYKDLNNYSAVVKISYGSNAFLFTGDAEVLSESEMLETDYESLSCDVLKAGHHGSDSSSSADFLNAVSPRYAVISCGAGNSYGHPHSEIVERFEFLETQIYRTDENGTITITCDGNNGFDIQCEVE